MSPWPRRPSARAGKPPASHEDESLMETFNRIVQGDSLKVMRTVPSNSVGLVLTDPPYGVRYRDRTNRSIANDDDVRGILRVFDDLYRVLKPDSYCISFYGWNKIDDFMAAWRRAGFMPIGHIVWHKRYSTNRDPSKPRFLNYRHEQAYLLAKGRPAKPAQALDDVLQWEYSGNRLHPTEKSVQILRPLVRAFSQPGDVVLDPFSGSASTSVAAALEGRRFFGIELDEEYFRLSQQRLAGVRPEWGQAPAHAPQPVPVRAPFPAASLDRDFTRFGRWLQQRGFKVPNRWLSQQRPVAPDSSRDDARTLN
jgi:DNA modification methylase